MTVCVCVCVRERERVCVCVCVCVLPVDVLVPELFFQGFAVGRCHVTGNVRVGVLNIQFELAAGVNRGRGRGGFRGGRGGYPPPYYYGYPAYPYPPPPPHFGSPVFRGGRAR